MEHTTLTQPMTAMAGPGTSVTLECLASGYDINRHHIHWTTQPAETGLVYIGGFRPRDPIIIVNKFKGRVALFTTGSTSKLRIDGLTAEDTAIYYCARGFSHNDTGQSFLCTKSILRLQVFSRGFLNNKVVSHFPFLSGPTSKRVH